MKKYQITIEYYEYMSLYQILHGVKAILTKRRYVMNGTKNIPSDLVAISMLENRYLFLYDPQKTYEKHGSIRDFTFEVYQLAALKDLLNDTVDCPLHLKAFQETIQEFLKEYEFETVMSDFQKYYTENWMEEYEISFTELRDEYDRLYHYYYSRFLDLQPTQAEIPTTAAIE